MMALTIRPQEAVAAIQALATAYEDYYGAVGDYNRGQFRLYRALGNPAEKLVNSDCFATAPAAPPAEPAPSETLVLPPLTLPPPGGFPGSSHRYDR
jgi:hypothetical protein